MDNTYHTFYRQYTSLNAFKSKYQSTIATIDIFESPYSLMIEFREVSTKMYCSVGNIDAVNVPRFFDGCNLTFLDIRNSLIVLHVLASMPFSEPLNYTLNIIWGHWDISLEHLKIFMELLKFFMIIGCSSNFIIYILMSEKLRTCLARKLKCCRDA